MTERWRASLDRGQDLSVQIFEKNGGIVLGFRGTLVDPDPSTWLLPLFKQVGTRLNEIGGSTITLDFTLLRYMNATSFRVFARWINEERTRNQGKIVIKGRKTFLAAGPAPCAARGRW
jgi:hypothetical protein